MTLKESKLMILQFTTGLIIIFVGGVHLAAQSFLGVTGYENSIEFSLVISRYKDLLMAGLLEALLVTVTFHSLNGLRIMLTEWRQGEFWEKSVKYGLILVGVFLIGLGSYTVLAVNTLTLGE